MDYQYQNNQQPPPLPQYTRMQAPPPRSSGKTPAFIGGCLTAFLLMGGMLILPMLLVVTLGKGCMSSFQTLAEKRTTFGSAMSMDEDRISKKKVLPSEHGESREIAVIDIKGFILYENNFNNASARRIAAELRAAREDSNVVAILLDMDTPGGEVVASDEILHQVRACRDAGKPVVTCMRSMGASGGYFIASGSDWIIANRMTFTGSIGVIISSFRIQELLQKIGVQPEVYRSGSMKDMLSATREHSEQEKLYVQNMVQSTFREFCQVVADGREAFQDADAVASSAFGDGRVLSGSDALELGLIDQLGYFEDAVSKARELAEAPGAAIIRFSYAPSFRDFLFSMKAPAALRIEGVLPTRNFTPEPGKVYLLAPETCL